VRRLSFFLLSLATLLTPSAVFAQTYGLTSRAPFTAYNGTLPASAPTFSGNWSAVPAFPNVTFLNAMGIAQMPGTNDMVVWEREGKIYKFDKAPGVATKTLILDIAAKVQGWDDCGLMAVAFHPDFTTNRYVFIYYTYVTPGTQQGSATVRPPTFKPNRDRLARFTVLANGTIDPASETLFIDQVAESVWHNGGGMFFHPGNGFLYLTNGDDARGVNTQRINYSLHSGVLRIDVDQRGGSISHPIPKQPLPTGSVTANYFIPNDNPFVGQANVLEEFFCIGLRSPHRMTHDAISDRIFIGDVGAGDREEIDVIEPGQAALNFQWDRIEGLKSDLTGTYIGTNKRPIIDYTHGEGSAVIGGYVYRGAEFATDLGGTYIFGDNGTGKLYYLNESTSPATKVTICQLPNGSGPSSGSNYVGLSSFGVDLANELYLCQMSSQGGRIFKLSRNGTPPPPLPPTLTDTGLFSNLATLTPANGFTDYDVINGLWSDAAHKTRWLGIPTGQTMGYAPQGEWTFPEGSVFLKHFELSTDDANPAIRKRLETRVLVRDNAGDVYGMTYKWNAAGTEASLIENAVTEDVTIQGYPSGDPRYLGELTSTDIGGPQAGSTVRLNDGYQISAGGSDIFGNSDSFRFAHEQKTGDFDIWTRVESVTRADLYTKAGLMVRESLAANSRNVMALVFPTNEARNNNVGGFEMQSRDTPGGSSAAIYPAAPQPLVRYPNGWLRMTRTGNVFAAYYSRDGVNWTQYATKTLALPATVYFGAALTSHNTGQLATAKFRFNSITRTQAWFYPGRQDCLACHTRPSGGVLGLSTPQSNRSKPFVETGNTDNQLRAWNHVGYFSPAINEADLPTLDKLAALDDTLATRESRVRSYLDSNCAHCHRPGGVHAFWDARFETPLITSNIVNGIVQTTLGTAGAKVIVPQDIGRSIMHRRMATATEDYKMPPLAKGMVDQKAMALLEEWIAEIALPPSTPPPAPWQQTDIGPVGIPGDASYTDPSSPGDPLDDVFTIQASGYDIWNDLDAFRFVYRPLTGDGTLTARVTAVDLTDQWAKAGVMIRETLAANSRHAMAVLTASQGVAFQRRLLTGGGSVNNNTTGQIAPYWVRIQRRGNVFTSYVSADGIVWRDLGSETIAMGGTVQVGLAMTAHSNSQLGFATFDNVTLTMGVPPSFAVRINFQTAAAPVPGGYLPDAGAVFGARSGGYSYGWNADNSANMRDRNAFLSPDQRYDTLAHLQLNTATPFSWEIALPNGVYNVRAVSGDANVFDSRHHLVAEGSATLYDQQMTDAVRFADRTVPVVVADGRLTLTVGANGGNTKLNFVEVTAPTNGVTVALSSPAVAQNFAGPVDVILAATAATTNASATITQVEFFNGDTWLGTDTSPPFGVSWSSVPVGGYRLIAKATDSTGASSFSPVVPITVGTSDPRGWPAEYFSNPTFGGAPITHTDATIDFFWDFNPPLNDFPADNYTVRWRGRIQAPYTETFTLTAETDDGVRVWVNGTQVVEAWYGRGPTRDSFDVPMVAGQFYDLEIEYFEGGFGASAKLFWSSPSIVEQIVPQAYVHAPLSGANRRPRTPVVQYPSGDGQNVVPSTLIFVCEPFGDVDAGQFHAQSEWEIHQQFPTQTRVWSSSVSAGQALTQIALNQGVFEGTHAGRTNLMNATNYFLRTRHRDSSGAAATEWSAWIYRYFYTGPWTAWRETEFTFEERNDANISGEDADPDRDGLKNLLENAFRLAPKTHNTSPVQITQLDPDAIYVTFPLNIDAGDLLVAVQHSTDIATWSDNGVTYELLAIANGAQTIRARIPRGDPDAKHFLRIWVSKP
jgi:regulation of enolase protein 1 (concanavalin A-like superfamily)